MDLDISESDLILSVPNKYLMDIKLPFPVLDQEGTAKFDKMKRELTVVLPVIPNEVVLPAVVS